MFESALEKIGRMVSRDFGIDVVFEGNQAMTDGKTIILPAMSDMKPETKQLAHGFLDHEAGHIKFTEFDQIKKCKNEFHRQLLNACEDERIEAEMINELPGCKLNLDRINNKFLPEIKKAREAGKMGLAQRMICSIRDVMMDEEGRTGEIEDDIKPYIESVRGLARKMKDATSTTEIRKTTEAITNLIDAKREEEKEEEKKSEEGSKGSEMEASEEETEETGEDGGKESEDKPEDKPEDIKPKESKGKKKESESEESKSEEKSFSDSVEKELKKDPTPTLEGKFNEELAKEIKKEKSDQKHIPITTQFDRVTSHSGQGNYKEYGKLKHEIMPLVIGIKTKLERILKVKENAKWRSERDRGTLDQRSLAKLAANQNYRKVFKDFTKTETKNVAIQILLDESGSMSYGKMRTAQLTAIAMAEALNDLGIAFEVTGFSSESDHKIQNFTRKLKAKGQDVSRFNRKHEVLDLRIYKDFSDVSLSGLEKIHCRIQNPDGECLRWAAKRLSAQKQKRKILIVLSDGSPATGEGSDSILEKDLHNAIKEIEKNGIETIGFGILTDAPREFYKDHVLVNNLADLPKTCMSGLARILTKNI